MFDRAAVLNPGQIDGVLDIGRILETMLYYSRVDFLVDARSFGQLWRRFGPQQMTDLLSHPSLNVQITAQMPGVMNNTRNSIHTHRPVVMTSSGCEKAQFDPHDTARALHQLLNNREPTRLQDVRRLVRRFPRTTFAQLMSELPMKGDLFESLISDSATMRIFLRAFALKSGLEVDEQALSELRVEVSRLSDGYYILSNIPVSTLLPGFVAEWGGILPAVQEYTYDLYLSQARSADVIASDVNSYIASERIDLSINRATNSDGKKSSFEEFVFDEARPFREAFNNGKISLPDSLKLIDKTAKFREWLAGLPPQADLLKEFHKAVTKDTLLGKLPARIGRFAAFTGPGVALDFLGAGGLGTLAGVTLSAIDSFVVEGVFRGWRPNHFVSQVRKALNKDDA